MKLNKKSFCCLHLKILVVILFVIISKVTYAQTLKFGVFEIEPWGQLSKGEITGINWEQGQAILNTTNLSAVPAISNYPRMIKQLTEGKTDCAIFTVSPAIADNFHQIAYLYDLTVVAISRKGIDINSTKDLKDENKIKTIGFANGTDIAFQELFYDPEISTHIIPSPAHAPLLLAKKRIDAFIGIKRTMSYAVNKANAKSFIAYPWYEIKRLAVWLQCSKKSSLTKIEINELRKKAVVLRDSGRLDKIINKWILDDTH